MSTFSSKKATAPRKGPKSQAALGREDQILKIAVAAAGATLILHLIIQIIFSFVASHNRKETMQAKLAQRQMTIQNDDERFADELQIAMQAQQENLAAKKRDEEYQRRANYDEEFAVSESEKSLLNIKAVAARDDLSPEEKIKKIAKFASPHGSGVNVTPSGGGYKVDLAFPMKEVMKANQDIYKNYMPGHCDAIRGTAAAIIRDVMAYGGPLGVNEITVHGQDISLVREKGKSSKEVRDWVVATAKSGPNWADMTRDEVEDNWKLVKDNCR